MRKAIPKSLPGASITLIAMTGEDKAVVPGKELILGLFAQTAKKNAKSLLNPVETVQYTARSVFQSAREAARSKKNTTPSPEKVILFKVTLLIDNGAAKKEALKKRRNQSFEDEKNANNLSF